MPPDSEAAWLEGLDSRTEQDRRDEATKTAPTVDLSGCGLIVGHEQPF